MIGRPEKPTLPNPPPEPQSSGAYFLLARDSDAEITVTKSRFLARARSVATHAQARETVERVRTQDSGASHVVFAYAVGPPAMVENGMSDDGEPHGTAGRPVLSVIEGRNLTNVIVTVTRWFGGTKLGTGGLVRAYAGAAGSALDRAGTRAYTVVASARGEFSYQEFDRIAPVLDRYGVRVIDATYGVVVTANLSIDTQIVEEFVAAIRDTINRTPDLKLTV